MNLFIRLTVNGEIKQNGNTSQFIFTPEEQIEYASNILSLEAGDIFSCGTCGGVGQGTNTFLKAGDVMETEIEGLGKMRNRMVAEQRIECQAVMPGSVPGIHVYSAGTKTWMAGTSPAMTERNIG